MSTPTGWRKMTKKMNNTVLKTSMRTNDYSPSKLNRDSGTTDLYQEIQAITDYRINNGTEQYLVVWCTSSEEMNTSWETEKTIEMISKDALPKYWISTVFTNIDEISSKSRGSVASTTKNAFIKKLKYWTSKAPSIKTEEDSRDLKELMNTPSKKRPRSFISEGELSDASPDVEKKHPKLAGKINENVTATSKNSGVEPPFPQQSIGELQLFNSIAVAGCSSFLKPDQIFDLTDSPQIEIGEVMNATKNPGEDSDSYLVTWMYVSNETADSLGMKEDLLRKHFDSCAVEGENPRYQLQRKKHTSVKIEKASIREVPSRGKSCSPHSEHSDQSQSTTVPPSELETMDHIDYRVFTDQVTDAECQTSIEINPFACMYCQARKGEEERLGSLRQRGSAKKEKQVKVEESKKMSDVKMESQNEEEEEDDDLVAIEYEIDKILNYRKIEGTNADEYYIRWKGFTSHYDTWEPLENLSCCDKALVIFYVERVAERKNAETEIQKLTASGNFAAVKKLNKPPPLPPIPQILMDMLATAAPVSDEEIELAFKVSKTVRKNGRWTKMKLRKILLDLIGESTGPGSQSWSVAAAKDELPVIRHQLLMLESERRKELVLRDLKDWQKKLNNIAKGRPEIVVENYYDLAGPPSEFRYINDNVLGEGVTFRDDPSEGCSCEETCVKDRSKCCPGRHGKQIAYNSYKRLRVYPGYPIYECNKRCKCGPECGNRVVQDGTFSLLGTKLCIFRTSNERGWGVKTLKKIKKGSFVCLYAGEIITSEEAENRGEIYENQLGASYLFDLDYYEEEGDSCPYTIDATKMGNISHFINHSCEPNLCVFNVWADCLDQNLPKLAFFALRDINKDEELTYDYGTHDDDDPVTGMNTTPLSLPSMEMSEIAEGDEESDENIMIPPTSSPSKNRLKLATTSGVRKACLCGAESCRKVLF